MDLRRDEKGRPVGLQWPDAPEFTETQLKKRTLNLSPAQLANLENGRQQKDLCNKGLHDMSIHGRPIKTGGRYCMKCKVDYQREWKRNNPDKVKATKKRYKEKKNGKGS